MATYAKFEELLHGREATKPKRCYYAYGPEGYLREEVVRLVTECVDPHDLDHTSLTATKATTAEIFAHLNQYPIDPDRRRLVVVRDAEKIKSWKQLEPWLLSRHIPQVVAVFVDNRPDLDTSTDHMQRVVKSGRLVKCSVNEDDGVSLLMARGDIEPRAARLMLRRAGDLGSAMNALAKAKHIPGTVDERVAEALTERTVADDFVDSLLAMRKADALRAAEVLPRAEWGKALGTLDHKLDALGALNRAARRHASVRDLASTTGLAHFQVAELQSLARLYDPRSVVLRQQSLALCDLALTNGAEDALLEVLVATW